MHDETNIVTKEIHSNVPLKLVTILQFLIHLTFESCFSFAHSVHLMKYLGCITLSNNYLKLEVVA